MTKFSSSAQETDIYTDGACLGNPGVGGWAFVVYKDQKERFADQGHEDATTNNRMELLAAIRACEYALLLGQYQGAPTCTIHTDSQYVQKGITEWITNWKKNAWRGSKGDVKNVDLWQKLDALNIYGHVRWAWVKGHAGSEGNERADMLATDAAKKHASNMPTPAKTATKTKTYLQVPFAEKDNAKKGGARWDPDQKKWYVVDDKLCQKWQQKTSS